MVTVIFGARLSRSVEAFESPSREQRRAGYLISQILLVNPILCSQFPVCRQMSVAVTVNGESAAENKQVHMMVVDGRRV
jgi:hypothetical protein